MLCLISGYYILHTKIETYEFSESTKGIKKTNKANAVLYFSSSTLKKN